MKYAFLILPICLLLLMSGCEVEKYPLPENTGRPDILIYCGMTMVQPVLELSALLEEQEQCRVKITYGGSGHLLRSVQVNEIGDIFFPGSVTYVNQLSRAGVVIDTRQVGHNEAVLFVAPGNPRHIAADVRSLLDKNLNVVIGSPEAGAVGHETRRLLLREGIYERVVENSLYMTTDSKGLAKAIRDGSADLVMNWRAAAFLPENQGKVELLSAVAATEDGKRPLVMGLLKYSRNPLLARKMMHLAASATGRNIFRKYGLVD